MRPVVAGVPALTTENLGGTAVEASVERATNAITLDD